MADEFTWRLTPEQRGRLVFLRRSLVAVVALSLAAPLQSGVLAQQPHPIAVTRPVSLVREVGVEPRAENPLGPVIDGALWGALIGGVAFEGAYLLRCRNDPDDGCMGGLAPMGFGAVVGGSVGGIVGLIRALRS